MRTIFRIVVSTFVGGVFAAGCLGTPATKGEPVAETEQDLGHTALAQERFVTYFSNATLTNEVGWCSGPFRCFGPKGLICSGIKTQYAVVDWTDCGADPLASEK